MKIIYTTDLHGSTWKYKRLTEIAHEQGADIVINGGDLLPKGGDLFSQDRFIKKELNEHFAFFEDAGIDYLCYLGNDDLRIWDNIFDETCVKYSHVHNIAQRKVRIRDIDFVGMNWVVDYPFQLKDRCRVDKDDYEFQFQLGPGVLSTPDGFQRIKDWFKYARSLPTFSQELDKLPVPENMNKAIYVVHMPPSGLGLDVCMNGAQVGSKALYDFLLITQPLLSLHGHIHESPGISGTWKTILGNTICVQPGQMTSFIFVVIDTEKMEIIRHDYRS